MFVVLPLVEMMATLWPSLGMRYLQGLIANAFGVALHIVHRGAQMSTRKAQERGKAANMAANSRDLVLFKQSSHCKG